MHQQARAAVPKPGHEVALACLCIHRHDCRTRAPDAVPGDGGLDAVGQGQRDAITRLHAARAQRNCKMERSFAQPAIIDTAIALRSEEHTSELQSLMRISYAVFGLKKK